MLADFLPVSTSNIVKSQRRRHATGLRHMPLSLLTLDSLCRFGFPPGRAFGRAEKATTSDSEVVAPERRALVFDD
jgi:hypothetical protein